MMKAKKQNEIDDQREKLNEMIYAASYMINEMKSLQSLIGAMLVRIEVLEMKANKENNDPFFTVKS